MKKLGLVALLFVGITGSCFAGTIYWQYGSDLGASYSGGWLVELVEDVNKDGIQLGGDATSGMALYTDRTTDSDDTFISTPVTTVLVDAGAKGGIAWGDQFTAPADSMSAGDNVYTIIYNADTFANATQYIIVDASPYALPDPAGDATYKTTTVSGSWAPIVPVPEPGTMALFALGLMTLVARRKRR